MEPSFIKLVDQFIGGKLSRRDLIQSLGAIMATAGIPAAAAAAAPAASRAKRETKVIGVNHISYQVKDYAKTRDYYAQNLGMKVVRDTGTQAYLTFGDTFFLIRQVNSDEASPLIDHIAYTIDGYGENPANWAADHKNMGVELNARGLDALGDEQELSWLMYDPEGLQVQVSPKLMKLGDPTFESHMARPRDPEFYKQKFFRKPGPTP